MTLVPLPIRITFVASVMNVADPFEIEATLKGHPGDLTCLRSLLKKGKQTENNKVLVPYILYTNFILAFCRYAPHVVPF